ncbi:hypothetical protein R1sor_000978 [Riccia sorocarpa]|uniref:Uncharacterized protein n=1 Tax=Riccia sorocarpa TaxID=122646 RepID=A0ABD3GWC5_9MARC
MRQEIVGGDTQCGRQIRLMRQWRWRSPQDDDIPRSKQSPTLITSGDLEQRILGERRPAYAGTRRVDISGCLGDKLQLCDSRVVNMLLEGWWCVRKKLRLKEQVKLPKYLCLELAINLLVREGVGEAEGFKVPLRLLRKVGVSSVNDLTEEILEEAKILERNGGRLLKGGKWVLTLELAEDAVLNVKPGTTVSPARSAWRERNLSHFDNKEQRKPVITLLKEAIDISKELEAAATGNNRRDAARNATAYLNNLLQEEELSKWWHFINERRLRLPTTEARSGDRTASDTPGESSPSEIPTLTQAPPSTQEVNRRRTTTLDTL